MKSKLQQQCTYEGIHIRRSLQDGQKVDDFAKCLADFISPLQSSNPKTYPSLYKSAELASIIKNYINIKKDFLYYTKKLSSKDKQRYMYDELVEEILKVPSIMQDVSKVIM